MVQIDLSPASEAVVTSFNALPTAKKAPAGRIIKMAKATTIALYLIQTVETPNVTAEIETREKITTI